MNPHKFTETIDLIQFDLIRFDLALCEFKFDLRIFELLIENQSGRMTA